MSDINKYSAREEIKKYLDEIDLGIGITCVVNPGDSLKNIGIFIREKGEEKTYYIIDIKEGNFCMHGDWLDGQNNRLLKKILLFNEGLVKKFNKKELNIKDANKNRQNFYINNGYEFLEENILHKTLNN